MSVQCVKKARYFFCLADQPDESSEIADGLENKHVSGLLINSNTFYDKKCVKIFFTRYILSAQFKTTVIYIVVLNFFVKNNNPRLTQEPHAQAPEFSLCDNSCELLEYT